MSRSRSNSRASTLGSGAGSFTPKVIAGFMTQHGLDPKKLTISNVAPPARATALLSGQVPAIEFFVMAKPGLEGAAKAKGTELRTFLLADHGLKLYSNGIVATEDYLAKNPDMVKHFVRASLRGWQFALRNPKKAAEDQIKFVPSLEADQERRRARRWSKTSRSRPYVEKNGLGSFDPAEMKSSLDFMIKYVGLGGDAAEPRPTSMLRVSCRRTPDKALMSRSAIECLLERRSYRHRLQAFGQFKNVRQVLPAPPGRRILSRSRTSRST